MNLQKKSVQVLIQTIQSSRGMLYICKTLILKDDVVLKIII
jgi:hypothetical protein